MDQDDNKGFEIRDKEEERRMRLGQLGQSKARLDPGYSNFIRKARLVMPVLAVVMIGVVFAWGYMQSDDLVPVAPPEKTPQDVGQNELLNPHFESVDDKKQPYTITAIRAVQAERDENLILLDEPKASLRLNSGNTVSIKSQKGQFEQDVQKLFLNGDVVLTHDDGYQMETQLLHVDLLNSTTWSDQAVYGHGPKGTLEASGLQGDNNKELLVFTGPAKLIINRIVSKNKSGETL